MNSGQFPLQSLVRRIQDDCYDGLEKDVPIISDLQRPKSRTEEMSFLKMRISARSKTRERSCHFLYRDIEADGLGSRITRLFSAQVAALDWGCSFSFSGFATWFNNPSTTLFFNHKTGLHHYCHSRVAIHKLLALGNLPIEIFDGSAPLPKEVARMAKCFQLNLLTFFPQQIQIPETFDEVPLNAFLDLVPAPEKSTAKSGKMLLINATSLDYLQTGNDNLHSDQFLLKYLFFLKRNMPSNFLEIKHKLSNQWWENFRPVVENVVPKRNHSIIHVGIHHRTGDILNYGWWEDAITLDKKINLILQTLGKLNVQRYHLHIFGETSQDCPGDDGTYPDFPNVFLQTPFQCTNDGKKKEEYVELSANLVLEGETKTIPVSLHTNNNPLLELFVMANSDIFFGECSMFSAATYIILTGIPMYPCCQSYPWAYQSTAGVCEGGYPMGTVDYHRMKQYGPSKCDFD